MSKMLEPLRCFASRRPSVVAATSLIGSTQSNPAASDASAGETADFLETKFGIRLEVPDAKQGILKISDTSPQIQQNDYTRRRYRIFPDWQTSFLWNDTSKRVAHDDQDNEDEDDDSPEVDDDVIEARYPRLWPFYDVWRQTYETEFEKQGCHLGTGAEVFSNAGDRISWDVEGLLMACWLVLREDVNSVEYVPRFKQYRIEKATIEQDLPDFLRSVWGEGAFVEYK